MLHREYHQEDFWFRVQGREPIPVLRNAARFVKVGRYIAVISKSQLNFVFGEIFTFSDGSFKSGGFYCARQEKILKWMPNKLF